MNKVSAINTFECSNGDRVLKSKLDTNVRQAKAIKKGIWERYEDHLYCQECNINESSALRIDPSHIISVKYCQETGRSELAWSQKNIVYHCDKCHAEIEAKTNQEREEIFKQLNGL